MIENITLNGLTWLNILNPTEEDFSALVKKYDFHPLDIEDCRSKVQRPKYENYDDYKFLVLQFPVMKRRGYRLTIEETDIFWGKDYIITLHSENLSILTDLFNELNKDKEKSSKYFSNGPDYLLYKILNDMVLAIFPLIKKISNEIDYIDTSFEDIKASKLIDRISALRRNIIYLQTSLKPQKGLFLLFENQFKTQDDVEMDIYWGDLGDSIGKLLDMAEDFQELTEGLYSSIDTLLTYRMNSIMKTLTIFNVIMLPLTFITGFYGMNIRLPLQESFGGSLIAVSAVSGIMVVIAISMLVYFKIRKF